jgi:lipid-A-disaccharide synthase
MKALIVAGEASGDLYGGRLASELGKRFPSIQITGMGGKQMDQAGVKLLYDYSNVTVIGVFEVLSKLKHLKEAFALLRNWIEKERPDFAILIDFPDFNFRLARFLKKQGIKVFYFISPQIWAWRKNRINFLRDHVDLMICVLPFEKSLYEQAGVPCVYCGHPLVEIVREELAIQPQFNPNQRPLIGLMPGSRQVEIERHLPVLLKTASMIRESHGGETVIIWPAQVEAPELIADPAVHLVRENRYAAMKACDLLIVASGTSTLECAILGVPLLIVYRVSPVSWQLGKVLVRVPYYGLVNWIAGEKIVPEFMQERMNPDELAQAALEILNNSDKADRMKINLSAVVESLGPSGTLERVVNEIAARL